MNDYSILVNSCDSHQEAWLPFFTLLKKMWPNVTAPVILNTETKSYRDDGLRVETVNFANTRSWSDRLRKVLNTIATPYVLIFLEDFFLEEPIDEPAFQKCLAFMRDNPRVGCISFHNTPDGKESSTELESYALLEKKARYRVNCQIGLWRTDVLKRLLRIHETAWEFEIWGSFRSGRLPYQFYSIVPGIQEPFIHDLGKPIYRGHWNMESVNKVRIKTGISIETNTLPCIENMSQFRKSTNKCSLRKYLRRIRSLL